MAKGARVLELSLDRPDADALGGLAVHVAALSEHAAPEATVFTAHLAGGELLVEEWAPRRLVAALPMHAERTLGASALAAALAGTGADVLHVHSPQFGPDIIEKAVRATGARLCLALHDHSLVCENYELLEGGRRYCGIPMELARCDRCLMKTRGRPPGAVVEHRAMMARLLEATDALVVPSDSVLEHAVRVHPSAAGRARLVPWGVPLPRTRRAGNAALRRPLRIAVVGVWAKVKGSEELPDLVAACRSLDVEWHLFGATEGASLAAVERSGAKVVAHGAYQRAALAERLVAARCDVVALPSVGAETFSLTLSEVTAAGFPVLASELGALGERVRRNALGWVFDPFEPSGFAATVARLVSDRAELERVAAHVAGLPHRSERQMALEHAELWAELAQRSPRTARAASVVTMPDGDLRTVLFDEFERGVARAEGRRPSQLGALLDFVKKTDFYRDLGLRRLLPESTRKAIEHALRRPSYLAARAKDRR